MNGPLTINGNYSLTVIIDDVPKLRELLTQNPNGSFRVIKRKRKVNIKSNDNDPELDANVEDPIENEIVDPKEILGELEDKNKTSKIEVQKMKQYHSDEKLHLSFELKWVHCKVFFVLIKYSKMRVSKGLYWYRILAETYKTSHQDLYWI